MLDGYLLNSNVNLTGDSTHIKMINSFPIEITGFKSGYVFLWKDMFTKNI